MTETQSPPSPSGAARTRSPEFDLTLGALRGLRKDLLDRDAFGYRPLPPAESLARRLRRLPGPLGENARWTPHVVVALLALLTLAVGGTENLDYDLNLLGGLIPMAAVLLTLVRPVAAFWTSMAAAPVIASVAGRWAEWPWANGIFLGHLVVLTVVALRTRPRTAAWMWGLTVLYGVGATFLIDRPYGTDAGPMIFVSAVVLLCVVLWDTRRKASREITAERHASAVERSRRTLLEERTTIARELHDVVAHHMSVVAIQAEAAPYRVAEPPPELVQAFAVIRENAVVALAELRRVLGVVRAKDFDDDTPPDAPQPTLADLDGLLANVGDAGLSVGKTVTGAVRELPQGVELSAYRIVQEALSNVLRHAPGAKARVELGYVLGGLGLRIVNGAPTGPAAPSPGAGHGLTGMRERVAMFEGEITAGPDADGGYEVAVFLPVPRATGPSLRKDDPQEERGEGAA